MVDPIEEEDMIRHRRAKQIVHYQKQIEELDKENKPEEPAATGKMKGLNVKKVDPKNSPSTKLFQNTLPKKP